MGIYSFYSCFTGGNTLENISDISCLDLGNWAEIKMYICYSNVIQRDSEVFARRLDKSLAELAKQKTEEAKSFEQLWTSKSRRLMINMILDEWTSGAINNGKCPTIKRLMFALSDPGFLDVKIKIENLLEKSCEELEINTILKQLTT